MDGFGGFILNAGSSFSFQISTDLFVCNLVHYRHVKRMKNNKIPTWKKKDTILILTLIQCPTLSLQGQRVQRETNQQKLNPGRTESASTSQRSEDGTEHQKTDKDQSKCPGMKF